MCLILIFLLFYFSLEMVDRSEHSKSILARGLKITEFPGDEINPQPESCSETDILLQQYLSPRKLCQLSGVDDLGDVKTLELKVDTSEMSLGNFGSLVPNLWELKLSTSNIHSIRDLGSSLHGLNILWMSQCCLQDLDGIGSLSNLKELYLSFNNISEISSISMLEYLECLDLECNNIDTISQIQYLSLCKNLQCLTLQGNPVCIRSSPDSESTDYSYRESVLKCVPQLKYFDDRSVSEETQEEEVNRFDEDWDYLLKLQQELHFGETLPASVENHDDGQTDDAQTGINSLPSSATQQAATSSGPNFHSSTALRSAALPRPQSAMDFTANQLLVDTFPEVHAHGHKTDIFDSPESISDLTDGSVFCGNPSKALRSRNKKKTAPLQNERVPLPLFHFKPEHTFDELPNSDKKFSDIIKQLDQWRLDYEKCQKKLEEYCASEILNLEEFNSDDSIKESTQLDGDSFSGPLHNIDLPKPDSENVEAESHNTNVEATDEVVHPVVMSKPKNVPSCNTLPKLVRTTKIPSPPMSQQHSPQIKTRSPSTLSTEKNCQLLSKPLPYKEPVIKNSNIYGSNKKEKKSNANYVSRHRPSTARAAFGHSNSTSLLPSLPSISIKQSTNLTNSFHKFNKK
ncbi:leucine-rich repeat-containing protein 56-like isoform X1 [Argonauta hians]